jgi:hypothetical protein
VPGTSLRVAKIFSLWLWSNFQVTWLSETAFPSIEFYSISQNNHL